MIRRWLQRRRCFHHDRHTGTSWIQSQLIDLGMRKLYHCTECGKVWIL